MDWEDNVNCIRQYCGIQGSEQEPDLELDANIEEIATTVNRRKRFIINIQLMITESFSAHYLTKLTHFLTTRGKNNC